jgi:predicted nucleic acid-binding protein
MNFLLDTCTLSTHLRRPASLQARFIQYSGRLYLPSVALAELYVLAYRLDDPTSRLDAIEQVIRNDVIVVDFDTPCARVFGSLRAELIRRGVGVSPIDLLIACVALTYDMMLVTHNTAHFQLIPGLQVVDWLAP